MNIKSLCKNTSAFFSLTVLALAAALFLTGCENAPWNDDPAQPHSATPPETPLQPAPGSGGSSIPPTQGPPLFPKTSPANPKGPGSQNGGGGSAPGPSGPADNNGDRPAPAAPAPPPAPEISFSANLVPLFQAQCVSCHAPPYSLQAQFPKVVLDVLDYETMREKAGELKKRVWDLRKNITPQGGMPMSNPAGLSDEERQLVKDWAEGAQAP